MSRLTLPGESRYDGWRFAGDCVAYLILATLGAFCAFVATAALVEVFR